MTLIYILLILQASERVSQVLKSYDPPIKSTKVRNIKQTIISIDVESLLQYIFKELIGDEDENNCDENPKNRERIL